MVTAKFATNKRLLGSTVSSLISTLKATGQAPELSSRKFHQSLEDGIRYRRCQLDGCLYSCQIERILHTKEKHNKLKDALIFEISSCNNLIEINWTRIGDSKRQNIMKKKASFTNPHLVQTFFQ